MRLPATMRCARMVFCMIGAASYAWRSAQRRSPGWGPGLRNLLSPRVDEKGASQVQKMDRAICRIVPVRRSGAQRDAGAAGLDPAPRLFVEIECCGVAGRLDQRQRPPIQGCRPSREPRRRRRPCADRRNRGPGHDGLPKDGPAASIPANGGEIVFCDRIDGSVLAPPVLAGGHRGCPAKPRTVILLRLRGVVFIHKHDSGTGPPPAFPPTPG